MKRRNFTSSILLPIVLSILTSGLAIIVFGGADSGSQDTFLPFVTNPYPEPVIPETTKVLEEETLQNLSSVSPDGVMYTFTQATEELDSLQAGDVIVGDTSDNAPYGFLRKVVSVSSVGDQVMVITEAATLTDAIEVGGADINKTLTPDDIQDSQFRDGVALATISHNPDGVAEGFSYILKNVVLYDHDKNLETTNDQILGNGEVGLETGFDFEFLVNRGEIERVSFTNYVQRFGELEISSVIDGTIQEEVEIVSHTFHPFTVWVGYMPIIIVPKLTVVVGVDGTVHVDVRTSASQQTTITSGILYENDEWSPIATFEDKFGFSPPVLNANAHIKGYAGAELELLILGIVGPHAEVVVYLELEADIAEVPWWQLYAGLEVPVGIKVNILDYQIGYETTAIDYKVLLAQAETPATSTPTTTGTAPATSTSTTTGTAPATSTPTTTGTPTTTSTATPINPPQSGPLVYYSHELLGLGGDDGVADCGNNYELVVTLHNQSTNTAIGVAATISLGDDLYTTLTNNTNDNFPDIPGDQTRTQVGDFSFDLAAETPDGHVTIFYLDITTSNGGPWIDSFTIPVECASPPVETLNFTVNFEHRDNANNQPQNVPLRVVIKDLSCINVLYDSSWETVTPAGGSNNWGIATLDVSSAGLISGQQYKVLTRGAMHLTKLLSIALTDGMTIDIEGVLWAGDVNQDNQVTSADMDIIGANIGAVVPNPPDPYSEVYRSDLNGDGVIDVLDLVIASNNLDKVGEGCP